jgi:hypothetical protein
LGSAFEVGSISNQLTGALGALNFYVIPDFGLVSTDQAFKTQGDRLVRRYTLRFSALHFSVLVLRSVAFAVAVSAVDGARRLSVGFPGVVSSLHGMTTGLMASACAAVVQTEAGRKVSVKVTASRMTTR